jgi:predicted nucleic acid-binding protein
MRVDVVLDASVAVKFYFHEDGSERARSILTSGIVVAAPELLHLEMASTAVKKIRMGLSTSERAQDALTSIGDLLDAVEPVSGLRDRAFYFARDFGFSVYDGVYLALAEQLSAPVLTADNPLIARAHDLGMKHLVRQL